MLRGEVLLVLGSWQCLSILITCTGVFSELLSNAGVRIPTSQSFLTYVLLSSHLLWVPRRPRRPLAIPWWQYALLALCDVEGNYLLVTSYQYTSITSVQLLDCFTIPCVMIFSRLLFGTRYSWQQLLGSLVCIGGLSLLVFSDTSSDTSKERNPFFGDMLVLCGCVFYAVTNVGQEFIVKKREAQTGRVPPGIHHEYLGMIGLFGSLISGVQMVVVERHELATLQWNWYIPCFVAALFSLYTFTPVLLQRSNAVMMNLSFLTADFWAVIAGVLLFNIHLTPLYFIAFAVVIGGLLVYNHHAPTDDRNDAEKAHTRLQEEEEEEEEEIGDVV